MAPPRAPDFILATQGLSDTGRGAVRLPHTLLLLALAGVLAAPSAWAGNVFVQIQCGNPPEIAETSHTVTLEGSFSPDTSSTRWLVPLAGRIVAVRIDETPFTVATGEIEGGFLEVDGLGRIFLAGAEQPPGYRVVVMDSQIEQLERGDE